MQTCKDNLYSTYFICELKVMLQDERILRADPFKGLLSQYVEAYIFSPW